MIKKWLAQVSTALSHGAIAPLLTLLAAWGCTRNTSCFLSDLTPILGMYIDARQPQPASEGLGGRGGLPRSEPTDRCYRRATIAARSRPLWFDGRELIIQSISLVLSKISKVFQPSLLCPIVSPLGSVQILRREV